MNLSFPHFIGVKYKEKIQVEAVFKFIQGFFYFIYFSCSDNGKNPGLNQ